MPRISKIVSWSLVGGVAMLICLLPSDLYIRNLVTDDALYYPTIARHICRGLGSTYDGGITETNGYHPLWCWLQLPIALLLRDQPPLVYLWWVKALMVVTVSLTVYVWSRVVAATFRDPLTTSVFVVCMGAYWWSIYTLYSMMETPLVLLFVGLCVLKTRRILAGDFTRSDGASLGWLMGAAFLARLDSVFFLGALSIAVAAAASKRRRVGALVPVFGVAALVVAPYLLWNRLRFGSFVPVSGLKKTTDTGFAQKWADLSGFWADKWAKASVVAPPAALVLFGILVALVLVLFRREIADAFRRWGILWTVALGAALHSLYTWLFMTEATVYWYQYSEYVTLYLAVASVAFAVSSELRRRRWEWAVSVPWVVVAVGIVASLSIHVPRRVPNPNKALLYDAGLWAAQNLPRSARCGMYDSGVFHFVSDLETVSLNGLAGDRELLEFVRARNLKAIVHRYALDYVVGYVTEHDLELIEPGHLVYRSRETRRPWLGKAWLVIVNQKLFDQREVPTLMYHAADRPRRTLAQAAGASAPSGTVAEW